jgi:uncharacterized OB-fold protein
MGIKARGELMNLEKMADIPPAVQGIFTMPPYDKAPPRLLGGFCRICNKYYFPRPRYCRVCLDQVDETILKSEGTIYSFTIIRRKPPFGLPAPYSVGYIDLAESGLRIFCLLDPMAIDQIRVGLAVRLAVGPLGHDGHGSPRLRPYFTPLRVG